MENMFLFGEKTEVYFDSAIISEYLSELWNSFCCRTGELIVKTGSENKICIGDASFVSLEDNDEYTVCITENGAGILADSKQGLLRGFMMLLMCIEQVSGNGEKCFGIACGNIHGNFKVSNRMVHLCVFPETTYASLRRVVRLCGVLQYTHIIIEFWGMLKFDCLNSLSWPCAFGKEEISKILCEAKQSGMELIPMFNHLGHASQCRIANGKHVVLDQAPDKQYLFTPDGWAWNIQSDEVKALLRNIRKELYELFGECKYVHLGCDEAYIFSNGYIEKSVLRDYLGEITQEAAKEGKIPIIWGDMIISGEEAGCVGERYYKADISEAEAEFIRSALSPKTIIADWQYNIKEGILKTSEVLKKKKYDVITCPWYDRDNIQTCVDTAVEKNLYGVMETTWHFLSSEMQSLLVCARKCGLPETSWSKYADKRSETATLIRKVSEQGRAYDECGFTAHQIGERNF